MSDNKIWQSFAELNDKEGFRKKQHDEFKEELPFEEFDSKGLLDAKAPRRDFLKYLGFSTAAATLAASCKLPVRKAIPYANRPENLTPGVPKYYASTYVCDGEAVPVVVKTRDGRPIKIEGNDLSTLTTGGTSARVQASVLDLYDTYRLRHPQRKAGNGFSEIPTFEQLDQMVTGALNGAGGPVVLLTNTIVSPTTKDIIRQFLGRFPGSRHVQYDAVSYSGLIQANGGRIPVYQFNKAKVIVSLGADFLGSWLAPVQFARQYSIGRKINEANPTMSKHYQFEPYLSMTGSCADERFTHRPSETGMVALALYAALGGGAPAVQLPANLTQAVQKVAKDLQANRGAGLVVCGSNDPNVQAVVTAINGLIGASGAIIGSGSLNTKQGIDADMVTLVNDMNAGRVGALLVAGANPVYDYFEADKFKQGLGRVKLTVSFNEKMDETTELCQYVIPAHHYLESWGDAEPQTGYISFIQPTIYPLFKTRPFQDSLLKWSGDNRNYETYFREYWTGRLGGDAGFDRALQDGILEPGGRTMATAATSTSNAPLSRMTSNTVAPNAQNDSLHVDSPQPPADQPTAAPVTTTTTTTTATTNTPNLAGAIAAITGARKGGKHEVVLYQKVTVGARHSDNPWLQEAPDPVTKISWDNYAMISMKKAEELGVDYKDSDFEYYPDKPTFNFTVNGKTVELPVFVVPGMNADTIAIAVGYGRSAKLGKASEGIGKNVYSFGRWNGTTRDYHNDVAISERVGSHKLAQVQVHPYYEGRTEVVRETTMGTFLKYPNEIKGWREELTKSYAKKTGDYRKEATLYGDWKQPGAKWGMSIDMNSCIGCHACVVACHIENNVPIVGKSEVLRYHDMHWLRIDRYFVTEENNPDNLKAVVFQPMLCQHCDNAPCENVCPVAATMHSSEGINQMAYNRCIGTRYCANNCPYKVRRFNWSDYTCASTHGKGGPESGVGKLDDVVHQMNDELTRMVLNPDVVTRSRGVMEKCTFCVQRTQAAKLDAKLQNRALRDGDVETACQQACPTDAIVFGNANDDSTQITQIRKNNTQRSFYVLEQIHTLPNVTYLAKVRNTEEIIEKEHSDDATHAGESKPSSPKQHEPASEAH